MNRPRARSILGCALWALLLASCDGSPGSSTTQGGGAAGAGGGGTTGATGAAGPGGTGATGATGGSGAGAGATGGGGAGEIPREVCRFDGEVAFSLPAGFGVDQLDGLSKDSGGSCAEGELSYATLDMDGDLRPDLVVADLCDIDGVGTTHWQVHLNEGDRFSDVPVLWTLPSGFATDQLDDLADDSGASCFQGELSFAVRDATGDLLPDLLIADDCDLEHTGTTHWVVYRGTGSGFEDAGSWRLPGPAAGFGFDALDDLRGDDGALCVQGELAFAALDLDGDRVLDLVVADDCDAGEVGTTHWRVFKGTCD